MCDTFVHLRIASSNRRKKIALFHLYNSAAHVGTMAPSFKISIHNVQHPDLYD